MAFVQSAFSATIVSLSCSATYASAQTAGNLNVIGFWIYKSSGSNLLTGLSDTIGNTYGLAYHLPDSGATATGDGDLWVYYAWAIASAGAGANTVTATFS